MNTHNNVVTNVVLKTPVLFIMGDTEGHDKLCCLVGGPGNTVCWYCAVARGKTDKTKLKFRYVKYSKLQKLMKARKFENVWKKGFYPLWQNGFNDIEFCDNVRGLNGALPPEMLHFLLLGYFVYLLSGFVSSKRINSNCYNQEEETETINSGRGNSVLVYRNSSQLSDIYGDI